MIFTFFFDFSQLPIENSIFEWPHLILVYSYMFLYLVSFVTEMVLVGSELRSVFCTSSSGKGEKVYKEREVDAGRKLFVVRFKKLKVNTMMTTRKK